MSVFDFTASKKLSLRIFTCTSPPTTPSVYIFISHTFLARTLQSLLIKKTFIFFVYEK